MDNNIHAYIKRVSERIPDEDLPLLASWAESRDIKKGAVLLKEGDVCREFYLVEKGYLRTWYNKDGVAINLNFTFEGEFTTNLKSLNGRLPSELIIEAGEDTRLWVFNLDVRRGRFESDSQIVLFVRRLAIHVMLVAEEHSNLFKLYTPAERYDHIERNNPKLLQRVSLSQLATYLGVTRETLSRIRAKKSGQRL